MAFIKTLLPLVLVWLISFPLYAAQTLTYGPDSKPIAGVKITMTESDGTVTILTTDTNGQVTLPTTSNTYTLAASLTETGEDPVDLLDAIWILQHSGELRTLTPDQQKAADVNGDGEVDLLDAIYILQHSGELRTLTPNLVFLDANTGNPLSETTFNPGDTPSITVIRTGDVDQGFDPTAITDHAPIITGKTTLTMDENETAVSTLVGTDADSDTLTYSITGGTDKDLFTINASTGVLSFIAGPDYEDPSDTGGDNLYDIEITVSDGTNDTTQALIISVTDLNDLGPVISNLAATVSVAENQTSVVTVSASDPDGDTLTYSLSGTDASSFSISSSGVITFDSAPDYETKTSYSITVNISDGTNTTTQAVTISVTNVNDVSPVISTSASFSAAENQTSVGTVSASDAEGDTLTYTLTGTDASSFSISTSGVITFDAAPDYETKTSYSITVNISDGVNTTTQTLTINVTNVAENENAPIFTSLPSTLLVAENELLVYQIEARDGDGDTISYSLSGTDAAQFNLSSSGLISFKTARDYENLSNNRFNITVTISDGSLTKSRNAIVMITNVQENLIGEGQLGYSTLE